MVGAVLVEEFLKEVADSICWLTLDLLIVCFQVMVIRCMSNMSEIMEILFGVPDSQCDRQ